MHLIEKLPPRYPVPVRCAITNRTEDPVGFVDCGLISVPTDEIFLGVTGLREAAKLAGMVLRTEMEERVAELEEQIAELRGLEAKAAAWDAMTTARATTTSVTPDIKVAA